MHAPTRDRRSAPRVPGALTLVLVLVLALAVAACSSGSGGTSGSPSSAVSPAASAAASAAASTGGGGDSVAIKDFAYGPASIDVTVGTTVAWTNEDSASHTVTADDGSFDSASLANGATFSQAFATAGTFPYHCTIHPNMKGTVIVK
jgi:plastocyanin